MQRRTAARFVAVFLCAILASTCGGTRRVTAPPVGSQAAWPSGRITTHVVLVSVDGLRPDAIGAFPVPTLQRLIREGSYTLRASTIIPSNTLPSHTSMLTGLSPDEHGVLWNNVIAAESDVVGSPTIFGAARARGYRTAAFFSKPKFQPLQQPGELDYSQAPGGLWGAWSSDRTLGDVEEYLAGQRPNLLFVHLADVDTAGHNSGWMSLEYRDAVVRIDAVIARLLAASDAAFGEGEYTFIVTADHGGHDRDHGTDDPRDVLIPWIAWGRGVAGGQLHIPVHTVDTASTVLWLLGIADPAGLSGQPVLSAFRADQ